MRLVVDDRLRWKSLDRGSDPHLFLPHIDWATFQAPNIIGDY